MKKKIIFLSLLFLSSCNRNISFNNDNNFGYTLLENGTYKISYIQKNLLGKDMLTIPEKYNNKAITEIGKNVFAKNEDIKEVIIPNTIKKIEESAFYDSRLEKVIFQGDLDYIGIGAFANTNIQELIFNYNVRTIDENAFSNCLSLKNVLFNNSDVDFSDGTFYRCESLENIKLPTNIEKISSNMFSECSNLKYITLPDSISKIEESAFNSCSNLNLTTLPTNLKYIGEGAFSNCRSINEITLPDGLQYLGASVFSNTSLTSFEIPDFLNFIPKELLKGTKITSINIPTNIEVIQSQAFYGCENLTTINLTEGLKEIQSQAFFGTKDYDISLPKSIEKIAIDFTNNDIKHLSLANIEVLPLMTYSTSSLIQNATLYQNEYYIGGNDNPYLYHLDSTNKQYKENDTIYIHKDTKYISFTDNYKSNGELIKYKISVDPENKYYSSKDGCVYSKDFKTLYYVPKVIDGNELKIDDRCEIITDGIFDSMILDELFLPSSLKILNSLGTLQINNEINIKDNENFIVEEGGLYSKDKKELYKYISNDEKNFIANDELRLIHPYAFYKTKIKECNLKNVEELHVNSIMASTFEKLDLSGIENITKSNLSSNTIGILDISSATNIESYAIQSCIIEDKIIFSDDLTTFKSVFLHSSVINQFNIPKNLNKVEANAFYQIVYDGVLDFTNIDVDFEENAFFGAGINKLLLKNQMNLNNSFISSFEIIESTSYIPYEYRNLCVNLKYIDTKDVTRICDFAYEYCIGPDTTVIISDTVISIGSNAFTKSLTFGDKIGNIFFESESLPEDLHPNWNPDNIPYYLKGQWEYENGVPKVKHL